MRIAMVSPLEIRVPPYGYGGTELVVSLLTEELVRRGHDVTLFASGDSRTSARLRAGSERFLRGTSRDKAILNMLNVVACMKRASQFNIIHNHTSFEGLALAGLVGFEPEDG
ncbi:MAG: glycosyltransferase [Planctomycetes bacterium]|nr:glycosyltransferase [Planctomycetota bacterium]